MNRTPLNRLIEAAEAVKGARKQRFGERLNPVAEMLECIRLARKWQSEPTRAAVVASLAEAWAADAIR